MYHTCKSIPWKLWPRMIECRGLFSFFLCVYLGRSLWPSDPWVKNICPGVKSAAFIRMDHPCPGGPGALGLVLWIMVLSFIGVQLIDVIVKWAPKGHIIRKALIVVRTLYIIIIIIADLFYLLYVICIAQSWVFKNQRGWNHESVGFVWNGSGDASWSWIRHISIKIQSCSVQFHLICMQVKK